MRCNDVASTSFRHHVPTRFLLNQCQIIIFLILKSDNIENSRIEWKGIVFKSNKSYIYYYFTLQLGTFVIFFLFHIEIERKSEGIIGRGGGGGAKGMLPPPPPSQIIGGPPPLFLRLCKIITIVVKMEQF